MEEEKEEIYSTIAPLKKQIDEIKLNEKLKKEKKNKREKIKKNDSLPNIEKYLILNNKFQLLDSDMNLWHMKKCLKFQEFKKSFAGKNISPEEILEEFVYEYDSKNEEERSDNDRNYMEALNMSANESKDYGHKNKYLPPLPSITNNYKKNNNRNNESDSGKSIQEINNSDLQINFDETEENKKEEENSNDKVKNEEKKNDNNIGNSDGNSNSNLMNNKNEKEETSFNLSDNTD